MVRFKRGISASRERVFNTSAGLIQARRACVTPRVTFSSSAGLCASDPMLTSTPSAFARRQPKSERSRRAGCALAST